MSGALEPEELVAERQKAWKAEAKALTALATAFGPLAKARTYEDLDKLELTLAKVEAKVRRSPAQSHGEALLEELRADVRARRKRMAEGLARELREACEARGLGLKVVRRDEPVEVRIAPFSVRIDREKGRAELGFAKLPLTECAAQAETILKEHERLAAALRKGFDPARFFEAVQRAWRAAAAARGGGGERVEIVDLLPYLAVEFQSKAFRVEPRQANYKDYSRARFAFDLMQLREAGGLRQDGWRLNLGVASGTTGSKKDRSLFVEDAQGAGEYKLSVYFTREEPRR